MSKKPDPGEIDRINDKLRALVAGEDIDYAIMVDFREGRPISPTSMYRHANTKTDNWADITLKLLIAQTSMVICTETVDPEKAFNLYIELLRYAINDIKKVMADQAGEPKPTMQ